jgi:hypothetical protein
MYDNTIQTWIWFCILSLNILYIIILFVRGRRGSDRMVVGFTTYMQSVPITTKVVSSNHAHREDYSIQHYVIKCVSDLRQIGDFLRLYIIILFCLCKLYISAHQYDSH